MGFAFVVRIDLLLIKSFGNFTGCFHRHPVEIDLTLACVGELNTTIRGGIHWPMIYGVGVNVKTGEIFPATFPDKGPDLALRCARQLTGIPQVLSIEDKKNLFY